MTSFSNDTEETMEKSPESPDSDSLQQIPLQQRKEDMDKVIAELTQAVMKSKNLTTLQRAMIKKSNNNNGSVSSRKSTLSRGSKLRYIELQGATIKSELFISNALKPPLRTNKFQNKFQKLHEKSGKMCRLDFSRIPDF